MAIAVNRPASKAASRAGSVGLGLGLLGFVCVALVLARLLESWRVSAHASSHHVTLLGQRLTYPTANAGAIVILVLALPAALAAVLAAGQLAREARAAAKLRRALQRATSASEGEIDGAIVIADPRPRAFCAGLTRPKVYVSTGAIALLDERSLHAVLEHERHHARRRDPLRLAAARVLAGSLFFVPGLRALAGDHATLAELGADEAAVAGAPGGRAALARAMLSFADAPSGVSVENARIDRLLGDPTAPAWRLPAALCVAAIAALALLVAVAVLAGRLASGSATLAPPFLSRQPCVLMLATLSAVLVLVAASPLPTRRAKPPPPTG
jgi:Zn-dependent protease with chaperone function